MGSLRARTLGILLWVGSAEAAGNAEVFDLGSKLKPLEYTVVRRRAETLGKIAPGCSSDTAVGVHIGAARAGREYD